MARRAAVRLLMAAAVGGAASAARRLKQQAGLYDLDVTETCMYPAEGGPAEALRLSMTAPDGTRVFGMCRRGSPAGTQVVIEGLAMELGGRSHGC